MGLGRICTSRDRPAPRFSGTWQAFPLARSRADVWASLNFSSGSCCPCIRHKALGKLHRLIGTNTQLESYPTLAAFHVSDAYNDLLIFLFHVFCGPSVWRNAPTNSPRLPKTLTSHRTPPLSMMLPASPLAITIYCAMCSSEGECRTIA